MKIGKKTMAFVGLAAGVCILATSAFADIIAGSGYSSLKESGKNTIRQLVLEDIESFTASGSFNYSVDDTEKGKAEFLVMRDNKADHTYTSETLEANGKKSEESITYSAPDKYITNYEDDTWYYQKRSETNYHKAEREDPFAGEIIQDAERVVDAFVGNLKDLVQVEEKDGKKMYIGNLSESQVPTLANAVVSFMVKHTMNSYASNRLQEVGLPNLKSEISVQQVSGKAIENEDGIIESVLGSGTLYGKDKDGTAHTIKVEGVFSLTALNETVVTEPNLDGKKVEYLEETETRVNTIDKKYIGTYRANMVERKDGNFVKVGERTLVIDDINDDHITATFTEAFTSEEFGENRTIAIDAKLTERNYSAEFGYTENGEEKIGMLRFTGRTQENLEIELDVEHIGDGYSYTDSKYESELVRVFD